MYSQIKVAETALGAKLPSRKNPTDAGLDVYSLEDHIIPAHAYRICRTGVSVEVPKDCVMLIFPKGKNWHLVGSGVVDAHYEPGEIMVKVVNYSDFEYTIEKGDPIAQLVLLPVYTPEIVLVPIESMKPKSERSGKGGIISGASAIKSDVNSIIEIDPHTHY